MFTEAKKIEVTSTESKKIQVKLPEMNHYVKLVGDIEIINQNEIEIEKFEKV